MKGLNFGEHLTIDGYLGNTEFLNDPKRVLECLSHLPELLDMRKLAEPTVYYTEGNGVNDHGGYTGVVVIQESHISVHTFPQAGFVSIDVYTCKNNMNREFIIQFFTKKFDLQEVEVNFIKRGLKYHTYCLPEMAEEV